jgi:hypothetical protein
MLYGEVRQHVRSGDELPHLVEDKQPGRAGDHQKEYSQTNCEDFMNRTARTSRALPTAPHRYPPEFLESRL